MNHATAPPSRNFAVISARYGYKISSRRDGRWDGAGSLRVLLIEDDATLGEAVRDHVAAGDHAVDWMKTIDTGTSALATTAYGLVLLDLRLPDGSGIDLLKKFRDRGGTTPVIILTAHDQISDRIEGLNSGADDYLVKPFNLGELTARMLAVSRRYSGRPVSLVKVGDLEIDAADRRVTAAGEAITLSGREWAVLDALAARPNAVVSKAQIEEALYAFGSEIESNTVEVYVSRLRKKLGRDHIATLRGIGYRLGREQ
jgi:two-component system, OmpR family, response regulator